MVHFLVVRFDGASGACQDKPVVAKVSNARKQDYPHHYHDTLNLRFWKHECGETLKPYQ